MSFVSSESLGEIFTQKYLIFPDFSVIVGIFWKLQLIDRTVNLDQLIESSEIDVNFSMSVMVCERDVSEFWRKSNTSSL